jgi:hypothetical protein
VSGITVLSFYNRLSTYYSLAPLLRSSRFRKLFTFCDSLSYCLERDTNRFLLIVRYFEGLDGSDLQDTTALQALRDRYDRIAFFDDSAGAGCTRFEFLPYVDVYFKRQLFRDREVYRRKLYGRQLYSDYYHREFGVNDDPIRTRLPLTADSDLAKLQLAWNQGIGAYPMRTWPQRLGVGLARTGFPRLATYFAQPPRPPTMSSHAKTLDVHARLGVPSTPPSVFYQRSLLLEELRDKPGVLTGMVSQSQYNDEIDRSKLVVSPFGWGEVCYRDFEAIRSGAILVKPDMGHLETWPDVYLPEETYLPFSWHCRDVWSTIQRGLSEDSTYRRIAVNAFDSYADALRGLESRVESFVKLTLGDVPLPVRQASRAGVDSPERPPQADS